MDRAVKMISLGMHNRPELGGVDRYFYDLSQALDGEVESFAFSSEQSAAMPDPVATGAPRVLGRAENSLRERFAAISKTLGPCLRGDTLLVSHFALYAYPLRRQLRHSPHVVHFHGPWAEESRAEGAKPWTVLGKKWIEQRVYRTANRFICLCDPFKQILINDYGIDPNKIDIVPGGVNAAAFNTGLTRAEARARLGWPDEGPIVLCIRRLARRMGIDNLIEAFATIVEAFPKATLMIGGKGPQHDELKALIKARGIQHRVRLLGFVPAEDLAIAYRAADFSIVPSRALEGFGLITLESMAAGTPVLVTPVGGLPSAVKGLQEQMVLEGTDVASIVNGLQGALSGGIPLPSTEACLQYVRDNFDWSVIAPRILEIYKRTLECS